MFRIDRKNRCTVLLRQLINQLSGNNQRLLVGKRNRFSGTNGIHGRLQPCIAYHSCQYDVDRTGLYNLA